jgi:hypothetical protein
MVAHGNLTKRLALLAEARRDDPRLCEHLIEAKAEIERLQSALLSIAKAPREPPAAHFMRDIANAALRPDLRDANGCDRGLVEPRSPPLAQAINALMLAR